MNTMLCMPVSDFAGRR